MAVYVHTNVGIYVDGLAVHGFADFRPVEIDEVQSSGSFGHPTTGHAHRVVAEDRLLTVIALPKADALPAP